MQTEAFFRLEPLCVNLDIRSVRFGIWEEMYLAVLILDNAKLAEGDRALSEHAFFVFRANTMADLCLDTLVSYNTPIMIWHYEKA